HNERAARADVYDAEPRQLLRDSRWLASISSTDIDPTEENDPGHQGSKSEEARIGKREVKIERNNYFARSASSAVKSYSFPMIRKLLLAALIAVPICYYFALVASAATYPGYSHVTRYASELGAADSPYPKAAAW